MIPITLRPLLSPHDGDVDTWTGAVETWLPQASARPTLRTWQPAQTSRPLQTLQLDDMASI